MFRQVFVSLVVSCSGCAAGHAGAQTATSPAPPDINHILDQGLAHSQVVATAQHLMDVIGPRLTGSPQMRQAEAWTQERLKAWGLKNVHKEGFPFGRGWSIVSSSVRMTTPRSLPLTAMPVAWTPPTAGVVSAPVVVAPMRRERDFEAWRGKLAGKIVLVTLPNDGDEPDKPLFRRLTAEDIGKMDKVTEPSYEPKKLERRIRQALFATKLDAFLAAEGAVAWAKMSYRDGKLLHGEGYGFRRTPKLPAFEIAAEDYRRLARLAKLGAAPVLEVQSHVVFDDADTNAYNVLAEIPGTDAGAGYVMAGAHLDSWVAGDGAADNGAGSVVVMEAARILTAVGTRPRRTIRFALWAGEEQGLLGSMAYVERHLAKRAPSPRPDETGLEAYYRWSYRFPIQPLPGHKDLVAYFNIDNGSGRIHGIHAEGNVAAVPLLREWLAPFASLGATSVVASPTGGTDHVFMQAVGLPAFQFVQDPLDYATRIHHSGADTFDHLRPADLRQAATVLAGLLAGAASSPKTLPRMPLPSEGAPLDPFRYDDDADD